MKQDETPKAKGSGRKGYLIGALVGVVTGAVLCGGAMVSAMPKMMNMPLMARLFGGNIAKVMGGSVARDEHAILADIVKP